MTAIIQLTEAEYRDHCESYDGLCTECMDITRYGETEPDAENYECPECDGETCMGIEQALLVGLIEIVEEKKTAEPEPEGDPDETD